MKDSLTSNNYEDFRKRYEGTYGTYSHKLDKPIMVQLSSVQEGQVNFIDAKGGKYHCFADSGVPFEFFPVDRRLANTEKGNVIYSSRKTATQWKRGVCDGNTTITNLVSNRAQAVSFNILNHLYYPDKDFLKAYNSYVAGERQGVALSDKFCIINDTVQLYNLPIGSFSRGNAKVHKLFNQEFRDLVSRGNLPIKVELM